MGKLEDRQSYIRRLVSERFNGVLAHFAIDFGMDPSYAARMLYPKGKDGAKGIGEDTWEKLITRYGGPPETAGAEPAYPNHQVEQDADARSMVIRSLIYALVQNIPAAGPVFAEHLKGQARSHRPRPFSTRHGILWEALNIAGQDRHTTATSPLARTPGGFAKKSS